MNPYDDIGVKLKSIAIVLFYLEAIAAVVAGFILVVNDKNTVLIGVIVIFCGPVAAWFSNALLYGFGELIDNTGENAVDTREGFNLLINEVISIERRICGIDRNETLGDEYNEAIHSPDAGVVNPNLGDSNPETVIEKTSAARIAALKSLYDEGLITEEEYKAAMLK